MKKLGIIGGLGPESTIEYYRLIVDLFLKRTNRFPELIIYCVDLKRYGHLLNKEKRNEQIQWLVKAVQALHQAGADFAIISANTPHLVFDEVASRVAIPMLSIVEVTCYEAKRLGFKKVGLMGTMTTMSSDFYERVFQKEGIEIIVPDSQEKEYIHKKLVSEIIYGNFYNETRQGLLKIIKRMIDEEHIEGLILGCTELPLILTKSEFGIPFLNTTKLHTESAVNFTLEDSGSDR